MLPKNIAIKPSKWVGSRNARASSGAGCVPARTGRRLTRSRALTEPHHTKDRSNFLCIDESLTLEVSTWTYTADLTKDCRLGAIRFARRPCLNLFLENPSAISPLGHFRNTRSARHLVTSLPRYRVDVPRSTLSAAEASTYRMCSVGIKFISALLRYESFFSLPCDGLRRSRLPPPQEHGDGPDGHRRHQQQPP